MKDTSEIKEFLSIMKEVIVFGFKVFIVITALITVLCLFALLITYVGNTIYVGMGSRLMSLLGVLLVSFIFYIILMTGVIFFWK